MCDQIKAEKEDIMATKKDLLEEYRRWTVELVQANEDLNKLLPPIANLSKGEKMADFVLTEQSLAEYEKRRRRVDNALRKLGEVWKELVGHGNH